MRTLTRYVRRPGRNLVAAVAVVATLAAGGVLAASVPAAASVTDVYMRDFDGDNGSEPSGPPGTVVWESPDIRVCHHAFPVPGCSSDQALLYGQTNFVFVRLWNHGPNGSGDATGTLKLYWAYSGVGTAWGPYFEPSGDWHQFAANQYTIPDPSSTWVTVPWTVPNSPPASPADHYCLLAMWENPNDPFYQMDSSTADNVRNNNNIAQHNVNTWSFPIGPVSPVILHYNNPYLEQAISTDLTVTEPESQLAQLGGTVTVDLGSSLFERWRAAGGKGDGIRVLDNGQIQIVDLARGRISGLPLEPGEHAQITMGFSAAKPSDGPIVVDVNEFGPGNKDGTVTNLGGVEYRFTVTPRK